MGDTASSRFGRRMRIARQCAHMRQEDLAEKLGWSRGSVAHIERGRRRVFLDDAIAVAELFGLNLDFFLAEDTDTE